MTGGGSAAGAAGRADCAARGVPRAYNEPAARDPHESSEDVIYRAKIMVASQGQLLAGKYRVERVLGQGGMGVVLAARHVDLDEDVAIKLLLPEAMASTEGVARFEREARAAVKIKSEHVARVMDVGRLENGTPYMVMELLRGLDLQALLRQRGPLPLAEVADYLLQAGEAIEEAHGLGIVHRDLKPPNLFFTQRPDGSSCIKVLDFGISKLKADAGDQRMTATSAIMGSPLYMSPEQLMSARDVDQRTDIWALGVICFELLAGTPPFVGETLPQLCMAISLHPPAALRSYRSDLPIEVESMVARCLNKNPDQRYAGVAQLAAELVKYAPPHARVSAERIERLAQAAWIRSGDVAAIPGAMSGQTLAEARSSDHEAVFPRATVTVAEFAKTKTSFSAKKLGFGFGVVALGALGALGAAVLLPARSPAASSAAASAPSPLAATSAEGAERAVPAPAPSLLLSASPPPRALAEPTPPGVASSVITRPKGLERASSAAGDANAGRTLKATPSVKSAPRPKPVPAPPAANTQSVFDDR